MSSFAVWFLTALLVAARASEDLEKEMCSPSLLQITSNVHSVNEARTVGCGHDSDSSETPTPAGHHHPAAGHKGSLLLQVAARTGEVTQYNPDHLDEDAASAETEKSSEKHPITLSTERRGAIASLLHSSSETGKEAATTQEPAKQEAKTKGGDAEEKPDAKELQGARIAPFGKEDTGRELQHHAARTQDTLVDAIENAEVAEIKRSIFRSLTRLRAAEIKEFDTIARLETQAIDEYNDNHHYRAENPLDYIHGGEDAVKQDKYTSFHD